MTVGAFVTGLVLLVLGAEALCAGATRLAAILGVSPLVIGPAVVDGASVSEFLQLRIPQYCFCHPCDGDAYQLLSSLCIIKYLNYPACFRYPFCSRISAPRCGLL